MKIAVIGGGASGIVSGYLLSKKHAITIYEKEEILGGNVRTLNKNIQGTSLNKNLNIENGVLGFSENYYPNFHKLLDHLRTAYHSYKPSISLFSAHEFYPARTKSYFNSQSLWRVFTQYNFRKELFQLKYSQKEFEYQIEKSSINGLEFKDFNFSQNLYKKYMQTLFMLSFSTPFANASQLPQSLINPYFQSLPNSQWSFIKGGVYSYIETILANSNMNIICNAKDIKVERKTDGVNIQYNGEKQNYDKVIIATTPGSVKKLLIDKSDQESKIFNDWNDQKFKTIAHRDVSFYEAYKNIKKTPMDLFFQFPKSKVGYNTYQNTVYQIKTREHYSFSYNLDEVILKDSIIHEANHIVPHYTKAYDGKTEMLHEINGNLNTFYAGAYLGNGLHEGAIDSAISISAKLDGIRF